MPTNLNLDDRLLAEAVRLGGRRTKRETVDAALQEFVPDAVAADWELTVAGQRVQVIKKDDGYGGKLEFGTEIISARDNTVAALLGASPGASTSPSIRSATRSPATNSSRPTSVRAA